MDWDMQDANNIRFLAVRGTIWVGDCQTTYFFDAGGISIVYRRGTMAHFFYSC